MKLCDEAYQFMMKLFDEIYELSTLGLKLCDEPQVA